MVPLTAQYKYKGLCLSFHFYSLSIPCSFHVQILTFCRRLPASLLPPACPTHGGQINFPKIQFCSVAQVLLERSVGLGRSRFDIGGQVGVGEEDWIGVHGGGPEASWMDHVKQIRRVYKKKKKNPNCGWGRARKKLCQMWGLKGCSEGKSMKGNKVGEPEHGMYIECGPSNKKAVE